MNREENKAIPAQAEEEEENSHQHLGVPLGEPAIVPLPGPAPSSSRVHSLFYGDSSSSAVLRPPAAALLSVSAPLTTAPVTAHFPLHYSSNQFSAESNLFNSYLVPQPQQEQQQLEQVISDPGPAVQLFSTQAGDVNLFTVSRCSSLNEQRTSQSLSTSSNNSSNAVNETFSPQQSYPSNSNSLLIISSGVSQNNRSTSTTTTTTSALTSQSNLLSLIQNSESSSSGSYSSDVKQMINNNTSSVHNDSIASSSYTYSSSGPTHCTERISIVNNPSSSNNASLSVVASNGGLKCTNNSAVNSNRLIAPPNMDQVLPSLPSSSRIEAPNVPIRQSFAPILTSNIAISRSSPTVALSPPATSQDNKNLPIMMSTIHHNSRGGPSNSRNSGSFNGGSRSLNVPTSQPHCQSSIQNQNVLSTNRFPEPFINPLQISTSGNMPGSSLSFRHGNEDFLPAPVMREDSDAPQIIPELLLEPNEAHPVRLDEPSASVDGERTAQIFAPHSMFSTEDEECLVSSSTGMADASGFGVDESRMGSSSHPTMPLLDSTVDSTGDPTPLECLDSPVVYVPSPVDSNSSSIDDADSDLLSARYPRNAIISGSSLKNIALASFPPKSFDSDSSDDEDPHINAVNFSLRSHHRFSSSSPLKPYLGSNSGSQHSKSILSPSSTFSAYTNQSSAGPSHAGGVQKKQLPVCNMDNDSSSQDSVEGVASSLELGLASAGHGLGCSDSVARSTPLLPPAQILERETPSPPLSSHDDMGYQQDLQEYGHRLPLIDSGIENDSGSSAPNSGSGSSRFVPVRARLHSSVVCPQYQLSRVGDTTHTARASEDLPSRVAFTTNNDYTVMGSASSSGNYSTASFIDHSVDSQPLNNRNRFKLVSMPAEMPLSEPTSFSMSESTVGSQSVTNPASNSCNTNVSTCDKPNLINCSTNDLLHSASSSYSRVSVATAIPNVEVGSSHETLSKVYSTRKADGINNSFMSLELGKRSRLMYDSTGTGINDMPSGSSHEKKAKFIEQDLKPTEMSQSGGSVSYSATPLMALVCPLQSESNSPFSQTSSTASSKCITSSVGVQNSISVGGLFNPIVSDVALPLCSVPSTMSSNLTTSSAIVDTFGSMTDSESLLLPYSNLSYTSAPTGDGMVREGNTHSLFHPSAVVKTHAPTTVSIPPSFSPKKVLMSTAANMTSLTETGTNEFLSHSILGQTTLKVQVPSDSQCSNTQSLFKPISTPSTLSFNKEDYDSKTNPEENSSPISYEGKFDSNSFHPFSSEDYLPISPSSALSPSAPCTSNSRFGLSFNTDVPTTQSQPINFSSLHQIDTTNHNLDGHEVTPSKFGPANTSTVDPNATSLHSSSSTLSPFTLSFNSSNSLLGNSFEMYPSSHSFTEGIASQQSANSLATTATTTYTVSAPSLKRDSLGVSENITGSVYAKSRNDAASVSSQLQEVNATTSLHTESDANKLTVDYYERSAMDNMRMLGDAYEKQEGNGSTSFSSQVVDHSMEQVNIGDNNEETLNQGGKRNYTAEVRVSEGDLGGVSLGVAGSLRGRNINTKSGTNNIVMASEVDQTLYASSQMISGTSYSMEQQQSRVNELGLQNKFIDHSPEVQHHKPPTEQHATPSEEARDQHGILLSKTHGEEMASLHSQKKEADVKGEKEQRSSAEDRALCDRAVRRSTKRTRDTQSPSCEEVCIVCVESGKACTLHDVESITDGHSISDRTVLSRAWASLPSHHLSIRRLPASNKESRQYGVFSKRRLDQHTFFGPMVGVAKPDALSQDPGHNASDSSSLAYKFTRSNGEVMVLDTSDIETSNWMSFVGPASTLAQQNCIVVERDEGDIYFFTSRSIPPAAQLRVGYSKQYAAKYGFQALQPTAQEIKAAEERDTWLCYECDARLTSSAELQRHLSTHEENEPPKRKGRARTRLTLKRRPKNTTRLGAKAGKKTPAPEQNSVSSSPPLRGPADGASALLSCLLCDKTFTNNKVLAFHQLQHGRPDRSAEQQLARALSCPQCGQVHASREELLSHVDSHEVPPTELTLRRERPPAITASAVGEQPPDSQPSDATAKAPTAEEAPAEVGSEPTLVTKLYDCPICRQEMLSLQQLRAHLPDHVDEQGNYHCPTCGRDFDSYRKVRRHIRAYCFNILHCTECNKTFPSVVKLKMHMLTHSDRRDFKCDLCESSFKRKDKLRDHQKRVHAPNNTRPVPSVISVLSVAVKKDKAQVSDAEAHRYRNSAYQCRLCLLGFKRRGMLVNHTLKRHPELSLGGVPDLNKPLENSTMEYHCLHCSKVYRSNIRRNLHLSKAHPGSKPLPANTLVTKASSTALSDTGCEGTPSAPADPPRYAARCEWCHREYLTQAKLNQHHRKYHRDKMLPLYIEPPHLQKQEQSQTPPTNVVEVASDSYEDIKQQKSWDQSIISYYVDNNNVARPLEINGKVNGVTQTEFVVYNSDPNAGGNSKCASNALNNDDMTNKLSNTKELGSGDLLTQAMGVICLDMKNANVATASTSNVNALINGRIVQTAEDGQVNKHHPTQSSSGPMILTSGDGTLNNGAMLGTNQNTAALIPASSLKKDLEQQQQEVHNTKVSSGELVTWTLLAQDSGNMYTIALPPGQLIQLGPNVVASTNTGIVLNEGDTYSTMVPVSR